MCDHCGCRAVGPIARLMADHDHLSDLSGEVRSALADGDEAQARVVFAKLVDALEPHVRIEEDGLFPRLRGAEELVGYVNDLEADHHGLEMAVRRAETAGSDWATVVLGILHDLYEHMYREDFGLFPAALATLDGDAWDALDRMAKG